MHDQENISNVTSQFHHDQLQGMAGPAGAAAVLGAFAIHDRMKQQDAHNDAMLNQQQIMNKQIFIQNCLLQGWTMDEVNEEIAAGEEIQRGWQAKAAAEATATENMGWGIVLGIIVAVVLGGWLSGVVASGLVSFGVPVTLLVMWVGFLSNNYNKKLSSGA